MPCFCHGDSDHRGRLSRSNTPFADASATPSYAPDTLIRPVHYAVRLHVDVLRQSVPSASVTITFAASHVSSARTVKLDAVGLADLAVSHAEPALAHVRYDGKTVVLTWATPFSEANTRAVTLTYAIPRAPVTGLLFGAQMVMTDHETERARYWLPCVDYPAIRTTWEFHLRVDKAHSAVANGVLVGTTTDDDDSTRTFHWKLDVPCPTYLACFAAGDLVTVDDGVFVARDNKEVPVAYVATRDVPVEWLKQSFQETKGMLGWLTDKLDQPFPFPKYYQFCGMPMAGAMENISLVTWGTRYLVDAKLAKERQHLFDLVNIHEMAHSFFGDMLVIRHFEHAWLKESWATYIEACWVQDKKGKEWFQWEMLDQATSYMHEVDSSYARPIVTRTYNSSWMMFDAHLYPGGSWRLHMLRTLLGDAAFWRGVQAYVATYLGKVVETEQFRQCLEEASGRNLHRFFDEWIYGKGYPVLSVEYEHNTENHTVKLTVSQTQPADHTTFSIAVPISIAVELADGKTTRTIDVVVDLTEPHHQRKGITVVALPADSKPKTVKVDPDMTLLLSLGEFNPGEDILTNTLNDTSTSDVVSRVRAIASLAKTGTSTAIEAIRKAAKSEPFFGVRIKAAEALAAMQSNFALQVLAELLDNEQDPMALWEIASHCTTKEPCVREALLRLLARTDLFTRAHQFALIALGKHQHAADLDLLVSTGTSTASPTPHNLVREGALMGLGEHGSLKAVEVLATQIGPEVAGLADYNRPFVIAAYAEAVAKHAPEIRRKAADGIAQLLRDPSWRVRDAAAAALTHLGAAEKVGDLEGLRPVTAQQDLPILDKQIHDIKAHGEAPVPEKVKHEIDELNKLVRKLADQVAALEAAGKSKGGSS